jgi:hypothetical protein
MSGPNPSAPARPSLPVSRYSAPAAFKGYTATLRPFATTVPVRGRRSGKDETHPAGG